MPKESTATVTWEGRSIPMQLTPSGWRARKRSRHLEVDYYTNIHGLKAAQAAVKKHLDAESTKAAKPKGNKTLEDVVETYRKLPKKARKAAEKISISRLRGAVRLVLGKELAKVPPSEINAKFWLAYVAKRQGEATPDLGARGLNNAAINSGMITAAAVFAPKLRPLYAEHGIVFPDDVSTFQRLRKIKIPPPAASDADMLKAWEKLKDKDYPKWLCIGLARFAGLRRDELENCAKSWVEVEGESTYMRLRDRPDEAGDWETKTGENYRALILHPDVATAVRQADPGFLINPNLKPKTGRPMNRETWFEKEPQKWVKPFTGTARKPLHRLRGLYGDHLAKLTADAVAAKIAGVKAAQEALGHTSQKTTTDHYLSEQVQAGAVALHSNRIDSRARLPA